MYSRYGFSGMNHVHMFIIMFFYLFLLLLWGFPEQPHYISLYICHASVNVIWFQWHESSSHVFYYVFIYYYYYYYEVFQKHSTIFPYSCHASVGCFTVPWSSCRCSAGVWEALVCSWCSGTWARVSGPGPGRISGHSEDRTRTLGGDRTPAEAQHLDPDAWFEWRPGVSAATCSS